MKPVEFMGMSWADWQRSAQGYITRNARYLDGVRKISYYTLLAAGAKRVKEDKIFRLATEPRAKAPKIKKEDMVTAEKAAKILDMFFVNPKSKVFKKKKK